MTTSTTTDWFPTVAEIIDEAAERARIDPGTFDTYRQFSARRSLNSIFTDWQGKGVKLGLVQDKYEMPITQYTQSFTLPSDCYEVLEAALRRNSIDVPMVPIARDVYLQIPSKDTFGRPDRYYIERTTPQVMWIWQTSQATDDIIVFNYLRWPKDIKFDMTNTPDIARVWFEALFDALAVKLYQKFGATPFTDQNGALSARFDANLFKILKANAAESFYTAETADRQRMDTQIAVRFGR